MLKAYKNMIHSKQNFIFTNIKHSQKNKTKYKSNIETECQLKYDIPTEHCPTNIDQNAERQLNKQNYFHNIHRNIFHLDSRLNNCSTL